MNQKMVARTIWKAVWVGGCTAALLAAIPTGMDWLGNPGGIFRTGGQTQWRFVWETWTSWFAPVALLVVPVFGIGAWGVAWRRGRTTGSSAEASSQTRGKEDE